MLTDDREITTPGFWNSVYDGKRMDTATDSSNTIRPGNSFDRFGWVAGYAEGPHVLEIAAGHAHVSKRIKAKHPGWLIVASDQAEAAKKVANFYPYEIFNAYSIPYKDKEFDTVIACQCLEYMEYQNIFLKEARRVARYLLCTMPIGIMDKWSQLREYTEGNVKELLTHYGSIEVFERHDDLLLVKLIFNVG